MFDYHVGFGAPFYQQVLLLVLALLLVPGLWWFSYRNLAALGLWRWVAAVLLRTLVLLGLILALAEIQMVRSSDRLTVFYLLDQSLSIPEEQRRAMVDYVNAAVELHREGGDRAGVIVFGRDAAIEIPPFDDDVQVMWPIESLLDEQCTDLSAAMRLAQASFPEDAAKRIVVVSDGNENLGDAVEQARKLAGDGVGIDVVPVHYRQRGEVIVERVTVPSNVRQGEPFDLKVVLNNTKRPGAGGSGEVKGRLVIRKRMGDESWTVSEGDVTLPPRKKVYRVPDEIDATGFYTYEAVFTPDRLEDDTMRQNNRATAFTHIRGKGRVLLIEDFENQGEFRRLVKALREDKQYNLEVDVQQSNELFTRLEELQQYDAVLLANVPREAFTEAQIRMLVRNTQQMGAGLVMLGGPNSFGAGGWTNTELEKAMPVDFQIKSAKVVPRGALAMIMHATEMGQGNFWQKRIAVEALKALGARDYCGLIHYGNQTGRTEWLWKPGMCPVGPNRNRMLARIGRMTPGDMPHFDPGMVMAQRELARLTDAAVKHMIIISDGDASPPTAAVIQALVNARITVSTVAVGTHGAPGSAMMANIARKTRGKYYAVRSGNALPRIFQREARRVAQPLIYEKSSGFQPRVKFPHEMIRGVDDPLPPVTGFVMTTLKENPLVEVALVSPEPGAERNRTILAGWTYGLGKAVAFTTDGGARYARDWTRWENYDKLFGQIVRWSMRPVSGEGDSEGAQFAVATDVRDGEVRVVVTALDKQNEFLNFLEMSGTVVGPDLEPVDMKMEQTAPGRYVGTFPSDEAGSYFVMVLPGAGAAPIRTGVNVPYSDEFRGRQPNDPLLRRLADQTPEGGSAGRLIEAPDQLESLGELLKVNTFRHDLRKATSSQDAWYYLVLGAACLFFFDVFIRRVQVSFAWVPAVAGRVGDIVLRRQPQAPQPETIQRLRSRKAEVGVRLAQFRASARFETPPEIEADTDMLGEAGRPSAPAKGPSAPSLAPESEEESYTERLLRAKQKAWEERKRQ